MFCVLQVSLATVSLCHKVVSTFANYKGNLAQQIWTLEWFLELCCTLPFVVTVRLFTYFGSDMFLLVNPINTQENVSSARRAKTFGP